MKSFFKYTSYVLRHKWFVFIECCKLGIPWRGLVHDLSKFRPSEWLPYQRYFYGKKIGPGTDAAFDLAWLKHQHRNPHHWQFWLLREDDGSVLMKAINRVLVDGAQDDIESGGPCNVQRGPGKDFVHIVRPALEQLAEAAKTEGFKVLEMPIVYRKEMLADWRGAGRANGKRGPNECREWYLANRHKMVLGQRTREWVERALGIASQIDTSNSVYAGASRAR